MPFDHPFYHTLPVGPRLFQLPLYLTQAGWAHVPPGRMVYTSPDAPKIYAYSESEGRVMAEFCLVLVAAGEGDVETRTQVRRVRAGEVFFYQPGEWHRHRPFLKTGWDLQWIHFSGDLPHRWLREQRFNVDRNVACIEDVGLFRAQLERLLLCVHRHPLRNSSALSLQAGGLLAHLLREESGTDPEVVEEYDDPLVSRAITHLWNFSHSDLDVSGLANHLGVHRRQLERRFRKSAGASVLEYIQRIRVERAASLLIETPLPLKHVVDLAGFRSREHLRLAFQNAFQMSPDEYRRRGGAHPTPAGKSRPTRPGRTKAMSVDEDIAE